MRRLLSRLVPLALIGVAATACGAILKLDDVSYDTTDDNANTDTDADATDEGGDDASTTDAPDEVNFDTDAGDAGDGGIRVPDTTLGCKAYGPGVTFCDDFDDGGSLVPPWSAVYAPIAPTLDPNFGLSLHGSMLASVDAVDAGAQGSGAAAILNRPNSDEVVVEYDVHFDTACTATGGPQMVYIEAANGSTTVSSMAVDMNNGQGVALMPPNQQDQSPFPGFSDNQWHHVRVDWKLRGDQPSVVIELDGIGVLNKPSAAAPAAADTNVLFGIVYVEGLSARCSIHYDNVAISQPR